MTRKYSNWFVVLALLFCMAPSLAFAAPTGGLAGQIVPEECNEVGGCKSICSIAVLASNVLNTGIYVTVFLSAVLFAWAGWLYLTGVAGSDLNRAKEIFFNVVVGLVIILIGWLVVDTLIRTLTGSKLGMWNEIC